LVGTSPPFFLIAGTVFSIETFRAPPPFNMAASVAYGEANDPNSKKRKNKTKRSCTFCRELHKMCDDGMPSQLIMPQNGRTLTFLRFSVDGHTTIFGSSFNTRRRGYGGTSDRSIGCKMIRACNELWCGP
jgi:hypothetical protein